NMARGLTTKILKHKAKTFQCLRVFGVINTYCFFTDSDTSWLNIKIIWLLRAILLGLLLLLPVTVHAQDAPSKSTVYTVKPGDSLTKIAANYSNQIFWKNIYEANSDVIQDPDVIHTGQKLLIPRFIAESEKHSINKDEKLYDAD